MARQAKIYFQDQLAGILVEGDNGYSFHYEKEYLEILNPNERKRIYKTSFDLKRSSINKSKIKSHYY